jgi:hypothetical protein
MKLRVSSLLHSPVASSLLGPNILLSTLLSKNFSLCSKINETDQASHPYKTEGKSAVPYLLIFIFFSSKLEDKGFAGDRICDFCKTKPGN